MVNISVYRSATKHLIATFICFALISSVKNSVTSEELSNSSQNEHVISMHLTREILEKYVNSYVDIESLLLTKKGTEKLQVAIKSTEIKSIENWKFLKLLVEETLHASEMDNEKRKSTVLSYNNIINDLNNFQNPNEYQNIFIDLMKFKLFAIQSESNLELISEFLMRLEMVKLELKLIQDGHKKLENDKYQCRSLASSKYEPNNKGFGVEFSRIKINEALEACTNAALHPNTTPQDLYRLGRVEDADKSYKQAEEFYRKSSELGYAPAQNGLGNLYANGDGLDQDFGLALHWYKKAAKQNFVPAYYNIGELHFNGSGVPQNYAIARKWHEKGAEEGYPWSQYSLGYIYGEGLGVAKDHQKARDLYLRAAKQGLPGAQNSIGAFYYNGYGGPKDLEKGLEWMKKAARQGDKTAKENLKEIEDNQSIGWAGKRFPTPDSLWCETTIEYSYGPTQQMDYETICWDKGGYGRRISSTWNRCFNVHGWCR